MVKKLSMTPSQRETALISLIKDCKEMKFNNNLIRKFESQLKEVQKEIKVIKKSLGKKV